MHTIFGTIFVVACVVGARTLAQFLIEKKLLVGRVDTIAMLGVASRKGQNSRERRELGFVYKHTNRLTIVGIDGQMRALGSLRNSLRSFQTA